MMLSKPIACPKPSQTRLMKAEADRKEDDRALQQWKAAVRLRDGQTCRCCKRRVVTTLELRANRAECHHIAGRAHKPTRTDVRNGILLCLSCHQRVERCEVQIVGYGEFTIGNRSYINADLNVTFRELA